MAGLQQAFIKLSPGFGCQLPEQPVKIKLDNAPTLQETIKAISQLKSGKAAGLDEIWKEGGPVLHSLISKLHKLFSLSLKPGKLPQDLQDFC